ncbi:MAG TPA: endo-1,4-beta-xylanase [Bacteroidales bacterium]|nr:endo-1,4-beta-xylanase [Bacteroidales bacterium]
MCVPGSLNKQIFRISLLILFSSFISCSGEDDPVPGPQVSPEMEQYLNSTTGLKDFYNEYFDVGVAISPALLSDQQCKDLILRHFTSLTAENAMKWSSIQPVEGTFNFTDADKIVDFAVANGLKVRGHTLCWHNQVPAWVFLDGSAPASKELVLQRLRTHITAVMNHFKGKVYCWDVVNEAIDDSGNGYRASNWFNTCGEDFIIEAFTTARQVDPAARLFYNDYSAVNPSKRDKIYELLAKLKARNIVDGVGLQGHWNIDYPSMDLIIAAFDKYKSLGIDLQITELDVSVYTANNNPEITYTDAVAQKQSDAYARFFKAFRDYKDDISNVTFWGLTDNYSWLNNYPVTGRKNYPLLFGRNNLPKKPYFTVTGF